MGKVKGTAFGVTGVHRLLRPEEAAYVRKIIRRTVLGTNKRRNTLVSGMAHGVDTEAVIAVWGLIPFEHIICAVPGTVLHNYGLVDQAKAAGATIKISANRFTVSDTYMIRNDLVVANCAVLLAFPQKRAPHRSGTWATINRARKAGKKVRIYPLDDMP